MEKEKTLAETVEMLAKDTTHWLEVKKILEDDQRAMKELIALIDKAVTARENRMSKLN